MGEEEGGLFGERGWGEEGNEVELGEETGENEGEAGPLALPHPTLPHRAEQRAESDEACRVDMGSGKQARPEGFGLMELLLDSGQAPLPQRHTASSMPHKEIIEIR